MSITINGQEPSFYGILDQGIELNTRALSTSVLTLQAAVDQYDSNTAFAHGDTVTLEVNGQQAFRGKVELTPRNMNVSSEGWRYEVHDAWEQLDNLIFQEQRLYSSGVNVGASSNVNAYIAQVIFQHSESLGDRIRRVVEYAIASGVDVQIGNISDGILWYRAEYKAQTCGEMIRDMMRLMPDHSCWIDHSQSTPTFNLQPSASLDEVSYDISSGSPNVLHDITELETQNVPGVVLQYEQPVTVDSETSTRITYDVAPDGLDVIEIGVFIEPVPLEGASFQNEYATVTTETIPTSSSSNNDILDWWIARSPELAAIADIQGSSNLRSVLRLPNSSVSSQNVVAHNLTVVDDGVPRPEPVNPNSTPVTQTLSVSDYPREIIEGSLPDWAGRRYRKIRAATTIAIRQSTLDGISSEQLRSQLSEIFNLPKTFDGNDYQTANFSGEVMGTNAVTRTYRRSISVDFGESVPMGIAQDLLTQLNQRRFRGSFATVNRESDLNARIGKKINFTGSQRSEWSVMNEIIQEVSYNFTSGSMRLSFGPPEILGATDLIERRRAARRNTFSRGFSSNSTPNDGVGGSAAGPFANFSRVSGGGSAPNMSCVWAPAVDTEDEIYTVSQSGKLFESLSSIDEVTIDDRNNQFSYPGFSYLIYETPFSGDPSARIEHSGSQLEPFDIDENPDTALDEVIVSRCLLFEIGSEGQVIEQYRCGNLALGERVVPGAGVGYVFEAL